jgi:hypothetical protein
MSIKIRVTREHFRRAVREMNKGGHVCHCCVIAQAGMDKLGGCCTYASCMNLDLLENDKKKYFSIVNPLDVGHVLQSVFDENCSKVPVDERLGADRIYKLCKAIQPDLTLELAQQN